MSDAGQPADGRPPRRIRKPLRQQRVFRLLLFLWMAVLGGLVGYWVYEQQQAARRAADLEHEAVSGDRPGAGEPPGDRPQP